MRSTLLASCLLTLSFGFLGCDDAKKTEAPADATAPAVSSPSSEPTKGGMMEAPKGAMEGPAATPPTTTESAPTPTPAPTGESKKEEMPK